MRFCIEVHNAPPNSVKLLYTILTSKNRFVNC